MTAGTSCLCNVDVHDEFFSLAAFVAAGKFLRVQWRSSPIVPRHAAAVCEHLLPVVAPLQGS